MHAIRYKHSICIHNHTYLRLWIWPAHIWHLREHSDSIQYTTAWNSLLHLVFILYMLITFIISSWFGAHEFGIPWQLRSFQPTNQPKPTARFFEYGNPEPWKLTWIPGYPQWWFVKGISGFKYGIFLVSWISMLIFGGVEACHIVQCTATPMYVHSKRHSSLECQGGPIHLSNSLKQITGSWHITSWICDCKPF